MSSGRDRTGGFPLACSFCGDEKRTKDGLVAGPGVYICRRCLDLARSEGLAEGAGEECSFCARSGRSTWGLGSRLDGNARICDACLDLSEQAFAGQSG